MLTRCNTSSNYNIPPVTIVLPAGEKPSKPVYHCATAVFQSKIGKTMRPKAMPLGSVAPVSLMVSSPRHRPTFSGNGNTSIAPLPLVRRAIWGVPQAPRFSYGYVQIYKKQLITASRRIYCKTVRLKLRERRS